MMNKSIKVLLGLICILSLSFILSACDKKQSDKKNNKVTTFIATAKSSVTVLRYSGRIDPIKSLPIVAPQAGVIKEMYFNYGNLLKKQQNLYIIKATDQQAAFQSTLADYLKAKQTLDTSYAKMQDTKKLFDEGIVSRDEDNQAKETYFSGKLSFFQAKDKFDQFLSLHQIKNFPDLSLKDANRIQKLLASYQKQIENIDVIAPVAGIALLPKESKDSAVLSGSNVKQGDVLLYIGDISGLAVDIDVNEININQIKTDDKVIVTSDTLSDIVLHGYIEHINTQALNQSSTPTFPVHVVVPKLTPEQQKVIHVGMTVMISIQIKQKPQIMVPIDAVSHKDEKTTVQLIDKNTRKISEISVVTGSTTDDSVVIQSGLKSGDEIVIPHTAQ